MFSLRFLSTASHLPPNGNGNLATELRKSPKHETRKRPVYRSPNNIRKNVASENFPNFPNLTTISSIEGIT